MTQEALKMALEALEYWDVHGKLHQPTEEAITAIKEALAQPGQEPVCEKDPQGCWNVRCQLGKKCKNTPPQRTWVGLTNKDITQVIDLMPKKMKGFMVDWDLYEFSKAYEAKLKQVNGYAEEKNT